MRKLSLPEWTFFVLLLGISVAFYKVISPYLIDIFVAVLFAKYTYGFFMFLKVKCSIKPVFASLFSVFSAIIAVVVPIMIIGLMVTSEAGGWYGHLSQNLQNIDEISITIQQKAPWLDKVLEFGEQHNLAERIKGVAESVVQFVIVLIQNAFMNIGAVLFHSVITFFMFYYLLLDGGTLLERLHYFIPLSDENERELLEEITKTVDSTLVGTVIIGFIEGVYGLVLLVVFGAQSVFSGLL